MTGSITSLTPSFWFSATWVAPSVDLSVRGPEIVAAGRRQRRSRLLGLLVFYVAGVAAAIGNDERFGDLVNCRRFVEGFQRCRWLNDRGSWVRIHNHPLVAIAISQHVAPSTSAAIAALSRISSSCSVSSFAIRLRSIAATSVPLIFDSSIVS